MDMSSIEVIIRKRTPNSLSEEKLQFA